MREEVEGTISPRGRRSCFLERPRDVHFPLERQQKWERDKGRRIGRPITTAIRLFGIASSHIRDILLCTPYLTVHLARCPGFREAVSSASRESYPIQTRPGEGTHCPIAWTGIGKRHLWGSDSLASVGASISASLWRENVCSACICRRLLH